LTFTHRYAIVQAHDDRGPWKVSTAEYVYELRDRNGKLVVGLHWHPASRSRVAWPHLHVPRDTAYNLGKLHPPTGRVSVEAVLRFAIIELEVRARRGWETAFERSERAFVEHRTWG